MSVSLVTQPPQWEVSVKGNFTSFCQFPTQSLKTAMTFFALVNPPGDPRWWVPALPLFYSDESWILRAPPPNVIKPGLNLDLCCQSPPRPFYFPSGATALKQGPGKSEYKLPKQSWIAMGSYKGPPIQILRLSPPGGQVSVEAFGFPFPVSSSGGLLSNRY